MSLKRDQTHKMLREQLKAAIERRDKASAQFDQVIREIPSGLPQQEGHDPVNYAYSEAMPGAGDSYFIVQKQQGGVLYVPFAAISRAEGERAVLAVDGEAIPDMGWDVRPDALAGQEDDYPEDGGADPRKA